MSYNQNSGYGSNENQQRQPNIPRPTSSGQLPGQQGDTGSRPVMNFPAPQAVPYYQNYQNYGTAHIQGQSHGTPYGQGYYGSYPAYYIPAQQQPQFTNPYYGYPASHLPAKESSRMQAPVKPRMAEKVTIDYEDSAATPSSVSGIDSIEEDRTHHPKPDQNFDDAEGALQSDKKEKKVVAIPGTSITLESEEDIKKWREERRKMWLVKISNQREKHRQELGVEEKEPTNAGAFQQVKKDKQFIQSIQNQINRVNPNPNLSLRLMQRTMAEENINLLNFIQELGDAKLLEYELTEEEKNVLFGNTFKQNKPRADFNRKRPNFTRDGPSRYEGNTKKQQITREDE